LEKVGIFGLSLFFRNWAVWSERILSRI